MAAKLTHLFHSITQSGVAGSGYLYFAQAESTNTLCRKLLAATPLPPEGLVVHTGYQYAGRGQMGTAWEVQPGLNLTFSCIMYPAFLAPADHFYLSMAVSLSVADLLLSYTPGVVLKWPNDVYIGSNKICGILIENSLIGNKIQSSIIGIGININQTRFDGLQATSLAAINGRTYDLEELLGQWCSCFDTRYNQLKNGRFFDLKADYLQKMWGLDEVVSYHKNGMLQQGTIKGVNAAGQLIMLENGTVVHYNFKEISFVL